MIELSMCTYLVVVEFVEFVVECSSFFVRCILGDSESATLVVAECGSAYRT